LCESKQQHFERCVELGAAFEHRFQLGVILDHIAHAFGRNIHRYSPFVSRLRPVCGFCRSLPESAGSSGVKSMFSEGLRQGCAVRLSRDKINKLAHTLADALAEMDQVEFVEDRNTIRMEVRRILEGLMTEEAKIDQAARQKIENQRRTITEGTQEWDILYRKYYNEEVKKLGI
jgi:hypothetical protein